ncbi:zinc finger MYM-type protein 6-like [Hemicordylus capensis]|uniref:zinc finger MYM-type protein 6-like n=1 Tax=Hemicordylus capensis TaxID=884348 RepID=UPI00230230BE|nr:zinc finger MYM-type protein 6-like [Hemicordylus capensis]
MSSKQNKQTSLFKFLNKRSRSPSKQDLSVENEDNASPSTSYSATISSDDHISAETSTHRDSSDSESESMNESVPPSKKARGAFIRKYNEDYLQYGFICSPGSEKAPRPQCVLCSTVLANEAMKPAKLLRHLQTRHKQFVNKPKDFFVRKSKELSLQKQVLVRSAAVDHSLMKAAYLVAMRIAKSKKPHSIGETLIKPCLIDVCNELLGSSASKKMKDLSLSNDTISRRINELSSDIEEQVIGKVKLSKLFSLQLDESTDISNHAILLCYVRYIDYEAKDMSEELLCCCELPSHTTGAEIFKALNEYMEKSQLDWKNCVAVCTDGAASMLGKHSGVLAKIRAVASENMVHSHCLIHRQHLAAKKMSPDLHEVLAQAVKIINFIKCNALNSRLFTILCDEMGSEHKHLLLHAEVRWLSRGKVLTRLFELRKEIKMFLMQKKCDSSYITCLQNADWIAKVAYLSDIFNAINSLNLSLQGPLATIFTMGNKISAFKKKLELWIHRSEGGNYDMFETFSSLICSDEGLDFDHSSIKILIHDHLKSLQQQFEDYYPAGEDQRKGNLWVQDPFVTHSQNNLTIQEEEMLLEVSSDAGLQSAFQSMPIAQFWIKLKDEYEILHKKAMKILLPFSSTYLCEVGFSSMSLIKTKTRNRLEITNSLRLALTKIAPRIERLVKTRQDQCSH